MGLLRLIKARLLSLALRSTKSAQKDKFRWGFRQRTKISTLLFRREAWSHTRATATAAFVWLLFIKPNRSSFFPKSCMCYKYQIRFPLVCSPDPGYQTLTSRSSLPDAGYKILATRSWLPGFGYQLLPTRKWLPDPGNQILATRSWLPDPGH